jgi:hypothetical protein
MQPTELWKPNLNLMNETLKIDIDVNGDKQISQSKTDNQTLKT